MANITTKPAAPRPASADRVAPGAFTARPKTWPERRRYLLVDAERILSNPMAFTPAERSWAADMVHSGHEETRR